MKEKLLMIVFVLILGTVLSIALVSVDAYTAPIVKKNKIRKLRINILKALEIASTEDAVDETFSSSVTTKTQGEKEFYVANATGDVAFKISGSGLWGPIDGVIALDPDLETIKGLTIVHQEETPGLGGRIAEAQFLDRFTNKTIAPMLILQSPGKASLDNEVDGMSGATLSCKAFVEILNSEIKKYISVIKENK